MKLSIPSTIDYSFLPRRKRAFYLPKIGKSHRHLSLEEIQDRIGNTMDLQEIEYLFSEFISHFTIYEDLLSDIKNEYSLVIKGLSNIQKEKEFLKYKIQKLTCENGHGGMLHTLFQQIKSLKERRENMQKEILGCKSTVKELEKELAVYIGKLYKKELNDTLDERQRMLLLFKGKIGFLKDWLLNKLPAWPELQDLYQEIEKNQLKFKELLASEDDYVIQKYDSPEIKKTKTDISDQFRKSENFKREIEKTKANISRFKDMVVNQDEKMEELLLLLSIKKRPSL